MLKDARGQARQFSPQGEFQYLIWSQLGRQNGVYVNVQRTW